MNDRTRAYEILRKAKEILAQRLTERVVDSAEEILNDASGDSFMGDIETIYDQIGMRLMHVSQMLTHLPTDPEAHSVDTGVNTAHADETFTVMTEPTPSADAFTADTTHTLAGPAYVATPALPAPRTSDVETDWPHDETGPASFTLFIARVRGNDLCGAGETLSQLLELDEQRGLQGSIHFAERLERDPSFPHKALQLRTQLLTGSSHSVLTLLFECFGLTGLDSLHALQALRRRMGE